MPASPHVLTKSRTLRLIAPIVITALASLLASCASPGPPRPPSLHLTDIPTDLTAQRIGDRVLLHWTTPSRTTDGLNAPSPLTAEICRETSTVPSTAPTPSPKPACTTVLHVTVAPGPGDAADSLPANLTTNPATPLTYRVRILNPEGRSAGLSKPAIAASGAAPSPVTGLHATASRTGTLLQWQPDPAPSIIELDRTLVSAKPPKPEPKKPASPLAPPDEPADVHLRIGSESSATDPGGTLDRTAQRGEIYTYRAQRIRTVVLNGKPFELRSDPSSPITIALSDTFPPATPTGLAAIPGGTATNAAIDLSWQPNTDPDLAGYHVYRRTNGAFQRITSSPTLGPAFSDTTITPGTAYTYRVTAVDNSGNESAPSIEVTETARPATNP
jgi:hypothetical protein